MESDGHRGVGQHERNSRIGRIETTTPLTRPVVACRFPFPSVSIQVSKIIGVAPRFRRR